MKKIKISNLEIRLVKKFEHNLLVEITDLGINTQYMIDSTLAYDIVKMVKDYNHEVYNDEITLFTEDLLSNRANLRRLRMKAFNYQFHRLGPNNDTEIFSYVYISLPQRKIELYAIEDIQNACGELMEALGYELKQKEEPIFGSFYQKIKFFLKNEKTQQEIDTGYNSAKIALHLKYLNQPNSDSTEKLSNAAANIINSLQGIDEGVLRLGSLLIVKRVKEGKFSIISETLSPELSLLFDNNPQLLNNPNTIYDMLISMKSVNHFKEENLPSISHE